VEFRVFPLSYNEYLKFHQKENSKLHFEEYLHYGGLPGLINLVENDTVITDYLKGIYSTILFKDVVARYQIRNVPFLQNLVKYLADITGNIISAKKISDYLKSQKLQVSPNIVMDYIKYLESAFFISKASRTDIFGKKIFEIGEKYYFEDLGLRNIITGYKMTDINKILENVVYIHLCIAGYNVHVGVSGQKEIDFICEKKGEKIYVQVCYLLAEQDTINREFGNLLEIRDNYPKYVVTMDESTFTNSYEGIIQINVRDFCLSLVS
jgi:predicted AAA+ superfamily ATPase